MGSSQDAPGADTGADQDNQDRYRDSRGRWRSRAQDAALAAHRWHGGSRPREASRDSADRVRAQIALLAEQGAPLLMGWLRSVKDPARRVELFLRALEYHVPKLERVEHIGSGADAAPVSINIELVAPQHGTADATRTYAPAPAPGHTYAHAPAPAPAPALAHAPACAPTYAPAPAPARACEREGEAGPVESGTYPLPPERTF